MSFNRGGRDRRPDRPDRPDRAPGRSDRPDRDRFERGPRAPRDFPPRDSRGGDGPPRESRGGFQGRERQGFRPRFDRPDEGGMSIRLDPRRLGALKHLAGEAGVRPGDLVRQWVEERIDASRGVVEAQGPSLADRVDQLAARVAALESTIAGGGPGEPSESSHEGEGAAETAAEIAETAPEPQAADAEPAEAAATADDQPKRRGKRVSAAPTERVALHDEMIAVLEERGPLSPGDLATVISERGRYAPPRSGKPLDAATVSQRASNPVYRSRFTRNEGRIALAR